MPTMRRWSGDDDTRDVLCQHSEAIELRKEGWKRLAGLVDSGRGGEGYRVVTAVMELSGMERLSILLGGEIGWEKIPEEYWKVVDMWGRRETVYRWRWRVGNREDE